jgi:hypothetical protein
MRDAVPSEPAYFSLLAEDAAKVNALRRLIRLAEGQFALVLIEYDLPSVLEDVIGSVRTPITPEVPADGTSSGQPGSSGAPASVSASTVVIAELVPEPADSSRSRNVLDQIRDQVESFSPGQTPAVVVITGLQNLMPEDLALSDSESVTKARRAIQPLNLGRNVLAAEFPCPLLLCLPSAPMALFLQSAPDISSWRSAYYKFRADLGAMRDRVSRQTGRGCGFWERRRLRKAAQTARETLKAEEFELRKLTADAESLGATAADVFRLQQRLGWVSTMLGHRGTAETAFSQALRVAEELRDPAAKAAAQSGQRALARLAPNSSRSRLSNRTPNAAQAMRALGPAPVRDPEGLLGRDAELQNLVGLITSVRGRFLTLWGPPGSGKSSLLRAGVVPALRQTKRFLPLILSDWRDPESALARQFRELLHAVQVESESTYWPDLLALLCEKAGKTVVIVCDQFEKFFASHPARAQRERFVRGVGACIRNKLSCRFVFGIRDDELGRMAEFEEYVPDAMERARRYYLPPFPELNGAGVLNRLSAQHDLQWPASLIREVVRDLTSDGRVSPVQIQLVAASMVMSGVASPGDYDRAGKAKALLEDYPGLVLDELSAGDRKIRALMARVLQCLADSLQPLDVRKIAEQTRIKDKDIEPLMDRLVDGQLVCRGEPSVVPSFELSHDVLRELVRSLTDPRRLANRALSRAMEYSRLFPDYVLGWNDYRAVISDADPAQREAPGAKELLRRSRLWGLFCWRAGPIGGVLGVILLVLVGTAHVVPEPGPRQRVVVQGGPPFVSFPPFNRTRLDTGLTSQDFVNGQELASRPYVVGGSGYGILGHFQFLSLLVPAKQGILLVETGREREGLTIVVSQIKAIVESQLKARGEPRFLGELVQAKPWLARELFAVVKGGVEANKLDSSNLGELALADPRLFGEVWKLLRSRPGGDGVALVLKADSRVPSGSVSVGEVLDWFRESLSSKDADYAAMLMVSRWLGPRIDHIPTILLHPQSPSFAVFMIRQMLRSNPKLAGEIFTTYPLESSDGVYMAGDLVSAEPALAPAVFRKLLPMAERPAKTPFVIGPLLLAATTPKEAAAAFDVWRLHKQDMMLQTGEVEFVRAHPEFAERVMDALGSAAPSSVLAAVAAAKPALAPRIIDMLLARPLDSELVAALSRVVRVEPEAASLVIAKMIERVEGPQEAVGSFAWSTAGEVALVRAEAESGGPRNVGPVLLDQLRGESSSVQGLSADTESAYREMVGGAIALLMASTKPERGHDRVFLRTAIEDMRDRDPRAHLRIAACQILYQAELLRRSVYDMDKNSLADLP